MRLQALYRGYHVRIYRHRQVALIQKRWRGYQARAWIMKYKAALIIQTRYRTHYNRNLFLKTMWAHAWVRKQWRMLLKRRWYVNAVIDYREMMKKRALVKIQQRAERKRLTLHYEARKVDGTIIVFKVYRHSKEAVTCYTHDPDTCQDKAYVDI